MSSANDPQSSGGLNSDLTDSNALNNVTFTSAPTKSSVALPLKGIIFPISTGLTPIVTIPATNEASHAKGGTLGPPPVPNTSQQERFCHGDDGMLGHVQTRPTADSIPIRAQMPEITEIRTGEEQDVELFSEQSRLYSYDPGTSEWNERSRGFTKILRCPDGRARIVARRPGVLNVACNHYIQAETELRPLAKSKSALMWSALDFAEKPQTGSQRVFALRLNDSDRLNEFRRVFVEEVEKAKQQDRNKSKRKGINFWRWALRRR